jgi:hypothetical protein
VQQQGGRLAYYLPRILLARNPTALRDGANHEAPIIERELYAILNLRFALPWDGDGLRIETVDEDHLDVAHRALLRRRHKSILFFAETAKGFAEAGAFAL